MYSSKKTYTVQEATRKLERYCAYQERCHQEVRQKLQDMHMIPEAIDVIIVHLLEHNFLNEERFAKTFVRGKFRIKRWGRGRLTYELKKKDISVEIVSPSFKDYRNGEYRMISFFAKKVRGQMAAWIVKNRITEPSDLLEFKVDGYKINNKLSSPAVPVFTRRQ